MADVEEKVSAKKSDDTKSKDSSKNSGKNSNKKKSINKKRKVEQNFWKRNLANIVTLLRVIISLWMLVVDTFSVHFFIYFIICGVTDGLDGYIARKFDIKSKFGSKFDSLADMLFVIITLIKVLPCIELWPIVWVWMGVIAALKVVNVVMSFKYRKKLVLMHTLAHRVSGLLFFAMPFAYIFVAPNVMAIPVCTFVTLAEIQEGIFIRDKLKRKRVVERYQVKVMAGITAGMFAFIMVVCALGGGIKNPSIKKLQENGRRTYYEHSQRLTYVANVTDQVEYYRYLVTLYCDKYEIPEYANLCLAIMQQESAGVVADVMQSDESGFSDTKVDTPEKSIDCGVQQLKVCLQTADVQAPDDMQRLKLAIQGYNYGTGYITWVLDQDLEYNLTNAQLFSDMQKQKLGWSVYGDPEYVPHVLRYYVALDENGNRITTEEETTAATE